MSDKAIFLDRDDTLIEDKGFINNPEQVKLLDGVPEALIQLKALDYKLIVVTNQSGIAHGIVTEKALGEVHDRLKQLLADKNAYLDRIYYCPYHPEGIVQKYRKESDLRKPSPGMLLKAADEIDIDLGQSWCIGNSSRDIEAGIRAGCKTILIDLPPSHQKTKPTVLLTRVNPDYKAVNIKEAVNIIKKHLRSSTEQQKEAQPTTVDQTEPAPQINEDVPDFAKSSEQIEDQQTISEPQELELVLDEFKKEPEAVPVEANAEPIEPPTKPAELDIETAEPQTQAPEPQMQQHEQEVSADKTEELLGNILVQLKSMQRDEMFSEFSIMRLFAGVVQILVLFCLLVTVWFLMSPDRQDNLVFISLGFAVVLQLMTLTFFIMQGKK